MVETFLRRKHNVLEPAKNIGGFHLENPLSSTPGNVVFLAHTDRGASVAVKVSKFPGEEATSSRLEAVFMQDIAARNTRYVAPIEDYGTDHLTYSSGGLKIQGDFFYSVTPYFPAKTMEDQRLDIRGLNEQLIVKGLLQTGLPTLVSALDAFESQGIVHRDIKASNALMKFGEAYVTDFGTAIWAGKQEVTSELVTATPNLVAPEQLKSGTRAYDTRTDTWYATELILFLLDKHELTEATLENPAPAYDALLSQETLERHLNHRLKEVPTRFQDVIRKGLPYKPEDRPPFREIHEDLEHALGQGDPPVIIYRSGIAA